VKRKYALFLSGLVAVGLTAAARLYARRPRVRIASHEGMEDPEIARAYNRVAHFPQMRLMRAILARRASRLCSWRRALDLGCGPGLLVVDLARQAEGLHVTGLDLSEEMLAEGRVYARKTGLTARTDFRRGDGAQIPFPESSFDLVVSSLSLHHWSEPEAVLREVDRVLRPGGAFLIADLRRDLTAPAWLAIWFATHVVVPAALRRINEPLASRDAAYTLTEVDQMARAVGLSGYRLSAGPLWLLLEGVKGKALEPQTPRIWWLISRMNRQVFQRIRPDARLGRIGDLVLVLETTGRLSGRPHQTPLQYERVGEALFVGSARGLQADWFRNLMADPQVRVRIKGKWLPARAAPITDPEQVLAFLELRLERHPRMIRGMLLLHGLPLRPTRADLATLASQITIAELQPGAPCP
jgi:deazaflavin-dependent oxidoreductase (nitroreductase family)